MLSEVDIVNLALSKLGERRISSMAEDTKAARAATQRIDHARRLFLQRGRWRFALRRATLAPEPGGQFQMPADLLGLIPESSEQDWEILGRDIYVRGGNPPSLDILYVTDTESEYASWSPAAIEAFAYYLAMDMAEELTSSSANVQLYQMAYKDAMQNARRLDLLWIPPNRKRASGLRRIHHHG